MARSFGLGRWLLALLLFAAGAIALTSCSGGGGGGGASSLSFSADKTSVSFTYQQNQDPPPQIVTITATGQYTGTLYISASISGTEIATPIPITVTGTTATVQISVVSGLAPGTHTGTIELMACSDSACAHQVGNSPLTISYTITVQAGVGLSPSSVSLSTESGGTTSQVVTVQVPPGQTSFSATVTSGSPWLTVTNVTASSFTISAASQPTGVYAGAVQVTSGSASATINVAYTVTAPMVQVTPSPVAFNVVSGATPSQVITVQPPPGQTSFSTNVLNGLPWLSVTNVTASSFTIAAASLPSGIYSGDVQVTSGTASTTIIVTYTVTAPSGGDISLAANPTSLTLSTVEDATTSATLTVTPPSWNPQVTATVEYPSGGASGWLTLTPVAAGETVLANAAALSAGSYTANIRLHAAYPSTDILVPVALTVGVGLVRPADVAVTVNAETTQAALSGTVPVTVVSGPPTSWSAASSVPWLVLTSSTGQTGQSLAYQVDLTRLASLPKGQVSTAKVTITPALTSMTPVSFNVNLTDNLPQITTLAPYAQLAGRPARVILRGSGFSAIASPAARFAIDGTSATSVTTVADTEVIAQFSATSLTAGAHTISVSNALGIATATGRVVAVNVPAYTYTAIPSGGYLRSLAYDPERDALYAANITAQSIMSFRHSGTSWTTTSPSLASAYDVGLTQDGTALFAITSITSLASINASGSIEVLDPASLATRQTLSLPTTGFLPSFSTVGFGIPTTNDGRSWVGPTTAGTFGNIAYITPQSLTPTVVPATVVSTFYDGPWYAMSRDGELLLINPSNGVSPTPPLLYMHAVDSVVTVNPITPNPLTASCNTSLSDAGDRVLFFENETDNLMSLRDGSFNLIGVVTLPASSPSYNAQKGLVTPDGTRVYVLAYRSDAAATSGVTPRVFVFDATTAATNLTVLGYFDVTDYPGSLPGTTGAFCTGPSIAGAVSLDGQTLFFAGNQNLLVVPVPATLSAAAARQRRVTPTIAWPVSVHY
jgi:hypothetical protein